MVLICLSFLSCTLLKELKVFSFYSQPFFHVMMHLCFGLAFYTVYVDKPRVDVNLEIVVTFKIVRLFDASICFLTSSIESNRSSFQ